MATQLDATVDLLQLLGEPTRVRLLSLLAAEELSVAELTTILDVGQSRVSTHLGRLREAGVVRDRRAGTSTFYAVADGMPEAARRAWALVAGEVKDPLIDADRARAAEVVAARDTARGLDALAGQMERHYTPGRTWEALARGFVGLIRLGDVLDVGAGDGAVAELLGARTRSITLLDRSERMAEAARARLGAVLPEARVVVGDAEALPFPDASFDVVLMFHVLTMVDRPARALAEAARVLRPAGEIAVITLDAHEATETSAAYGEVHAGFSPHKLRRALTKAGLTVDRCDVTSREKRPPCFRVVSAFARRGGPSP